MEDLLALYNRALFVVITRHATTHPYGLNALFEAMAMGKAVIVTNGPDIDLDPEELGFGIRVPPHDPFALKEAIHYMLNNREEVYRMGVQARKLIESHYNTTNMGNALYGAISPLLRR